METLARAEKRVEKRAKEARQKAWQSYTGGFRPEVAGPERIIQNCEDESTGKFHATGELNDLSRRGFRPIAEIQYLDYLIYALPVISDDLASMHYRTKGKQIAP